MSNPDQVECVGTLLVHSSDVQELSEISNTQANKESFGANLQRRVTVGTLLVPSSDLKSPEEKDEEHSKEASPMASMTMRITRRITDKLNSQAPPDEDCDNWAD